MISRRQFLKRTAFLAAGLSLYTRCSGKKQQPNVLFIAIDDLRPELGCYGNKTIKTPNLDRLASTSMVFERAYCQEPICMASRASLLTGYRPDHGNIYNCDAIESLLPGVLTLDQHFENHGYNIWATGKIYHHRIDHETQFGEHWQNPETHEIGRGYLAKQSIRAVKQYAQVYDKIRGGDSNGRGPAYEAPDVSDNAYVDGAQTDMALARMKEMASGKNPFFMAVGYHKPHLPFNAPKRYWDLYDPDELALADNPYLPQNATSFTPYHFGELRNYYGIPKDKDLLPTELSRTLKHGYYACVSYIDAQIGRLLDALKENGLAENTIVIVWGDHGWKLGEHGMWCKHTPFELDAHVPMIIRVPYLENSKGRTKAFAEFVDIYPTLCDLCHLPLPPHLQGNSLLPVLKDPSIPWKPAAFTQWPKVARRDPERVVTAYSMKTDRYRYVEWIRNKTGTVLARELYDHENDPQENRNLAELPGMQETVNKLSDMLKGGKGWQDLRPVS